MIPPNHRGRLHTCVLIENVILPPSSGFWDAFAGLWSRWRDIETDEDVLSATIIVTNANETLRPIHDRMPVILEPDSFQPWLSGEAGTDLLVPAAEEMLTSWPVSTRVNKTGGADGATLTDTGALAKFSPPRIGSISRTGRSPERPPKKLGDGLIRRPHGVVGEMGVTFGGGGFPVTKELADQRQGQAARNSDAGETVPQVVDTDILNVCRFADAIPRLADIDEVGAGFSADNDEGIAFDVGQGGQDLLGQRVEVDRLAPRLAVGKVDQRSVNMDIVPTQSENFTKPCTGEQQQADCGNHKGGFRAVLLGL